VRTAKEVGEGIIAGATLFADVNKEEEFTRFTNYYIA
jgi:hypothetical protein